MTRTKIIHDKDKPIHYQENISMTRTNIFTPRKAIFMTRTNVFMEMTTIYGKDIHISDRGKLNMAMTNKFTARASHTIFHLMRWSSSSSTRTANPTSAPWVVWSTRKVPQLSRSPFPRRCSSLHEVGSCCTSQL